jgi:hypothetical protein
MGKLKKEEFLKLKVTAGRKINRPADVELGEVGKLLEIMTDESKPTHNGIKSIIDQVRKIQASIDTTSEAKQKAFNRFSEKSKIFVEDLMTFDDKLDSYGEKIENNPAHQKIQEQFDLLTDKRSRKYSTFIEVDSKNEDYYLKFRDLSKKFNIHVSEKRDIKAGLPYMVAGGQFKARSKSGLIKPSGLMLFDFDHVVDVESTIDDLKKNKHIAFIFRSPSGDGIKFAVLTDCSSEEYTFLYHQWNEDFPSDYFDSSTCDISRATFLTVDPDLYIADEAETYEINPATLGKIAEEEYSKQKASENRGSRFTNASIKEAVEFNFKDRDNVAITASILERLEPAYFVDNYSDWFKICSAVWSFCGQDGYQVFFDWSMLGTKRSEAKILEQWTITAKHNAGNITPAFLFAIAKKQGIEILSKQEKEIKYYSGSVAQASVKFDISQAQVKAIKKLGESGLTDKVMLFEYMSNSMELVNDISTSKIFDKKTGEEIDANTLYVRLSYTLQISHKDVVAALGSNDIVQKKSSLSERILEWNENKEFQSGIIEGIANSVKLKDETPALRAYFNSMFRKHLIRSIGQAYGNMINRYVFCMVDDNLQNIGKSTFIRFLGGIKPSANKSRFENSSEDYAGLSNLYTDEEIKDDLQTKLLLTGKLVYSLEELEALKPSQLATMKSIISKPKYDIRPLYSNQTEERPKTASMFASTNKLEFLTDVKNSRWLVFEVTGFDFNYSSEFNPFDMWCEAANAFFAGEDCELLPDEVDYQDLSNKQFEKAELVQEIIEELHSEDGIKYTLPSTVFQQFIAKESGRNDQYKFRDAVDKLDWIKKHRARYKGSKHPMTVITFESISPSVIGKIWNGAGRISECESEHRAGWEKGTYTTTLTPIQSYNQKQKNETAVIQEPNN